MALVNIFIHIFLAILMPPLLLGVINRTKALFAGRSGAPLLQPYYDIIRLWSKGSVFSPTTSWIFRASPVVTIATATVAALLMPLGNHPAPLAFNGDMLLFAYLFSLARFFTVAAALDTGSSFEGMGAAREVSFASMAEPALFLVLVVMARATGSLSLSGMLGPALLLQAHPGRNPLQIKAMLMNSAETVARPSPVVLWSRKIM